MTRGRTTDEQLIVYGVNAVLELLRSREVVQRLLLGAGPRRDELAAAAAARGLAPTDADRGMLDRLAGSGQHQGVIAITPGFRYAALTDLVATRAVLLLDGVQDPRNLGAILRTARAAGVDGVVLPRDRSVRVTAVVANASAGLLFGLAIARVPNLARAMEELKRGGFWMVGLVPDSAQSLFGFEAPARFGLVVGGEGEGLRPLIRRGCDYEVGLPMRRGVESLNVAVATGIALYDLLWRRSPI